MPLRQSLQNAAPSFEVPMFVLLQCGHLTVAVDVEEGPGPAVVSDCPAEPLSSYQGCASFRRHCGFVTPFRQTLTAFFAIHCSQNRLSQHSDAMPRSLQQRVSAFDFAASQAEA